MPLFNRFGRPGLLGLAARTAVVAGTATAVSGGLRGVQQRRAQESAELAEYEEQQRQAAAQESLQEPGHTPGGSGSNDVIIELERLAALHERGVLTDDEFTAAKAKLLT